MKKQLIFLSGLLASNQANSITPKQAISIAAMAATAFSIHKYYETDKKIAVLSNQYSKGGLEDEKNSRGWGVLFFSYIAIGTNDNFLEFIKSVFKIKELNTEIFLQKGFWGLALASLAYAAFITHKQRKQGGEWGYFIYNLLPFAGVAYGVMILFALKEMCPIIR